jgi:hypothetical protein
MTGTGVNKNIKLLMLVGALVLPTVLAYLGYSKFNWRPSQQKNYGELLRPAPLTHTAGIRMDGAPSGFDRMQGKWVLVYVGPSACEEACRKTLYYMRQTRILQDGERHRINLVWVLTDAGVVEDDLLQALPELHVWRPADPLFVRQFPMKSAGASHVYLIDPLGNLMLRFPDRPDAKRMMKDIKLLLKASQIG